MSRTDEVEAATFDRLQQIEAGRFQLLGDDVLPTLEAALISLRPNGISIEGKTRIGVPDSYVGESASACRAAVEYTTQKDGLIGKLSTDYRNVRETCPHASLVVLCTSRDIETLDLSALRAEAAADQVRLRVVGGRELAAALCGKRQDLRQRYLGLPLGAHSAASLIASLEHRLGAEAGGLDPTGLDALIARPRTDRAVLDRIRKGPGRTTITGPSGIGKSTWSLELLRRLATSRPVAWIAAPELATTVEDPIALRIVHAAYGEPDPSRVRELSDLLRRASLRLVLCIDAVDEAHDFEALARSVTVFHRGALGPATHLLLTCRTEARAMVAPAFSLAGYSEEEAEVALQPLTDSDARTLLSRRGASADEARTIESALSESDFGNPMQLRHALAILRSGGAIPTELAEAALNHRISEITRRLRRLGASPLPIVVERSLGRLALASQRAPSAEVDFRDLAALGEPLLCQDGESTLVGRAVSAGLLCRTATALRFSHASLAESLTARHLANLPDWRELLDQMPVNRAIGVARRMAPLLSDSGPLVDYLLARAPQAAVAIVGAAWRALDAPRQAALLDVIRSLLESRFSADRETGIDALGRLGRDGRSLAVEWFNQMEPRARHRWYLASADLFLTLEEPGAAPVVAAHPGFRTGWYEPSFVRRVSRASSSFGKALGKWAWEQLSAPTGGDKDAAITILAMLRDERLAAHLADLTRDQPLGECAHRALIHLDTPAAMEVYADSVDKLVARCRAIGDERDSSRSERSAIWHQIVIKQADIAMFPHGQLTELAELALESGVPDLVWFGGEWASTLASPALAAPYARAIARHPRSWMAWIGDGIETIVRTLSFAQLRAMYDNGFRTLQHHIVHHLWMVPGREVEDFLLARLEEADLRASAVQAIGRLGTVRAAPVILELLLSDDPRTRAAAAKCLGHLHADIAVPELAHALRAITAREPGDRSDADKHLEHTLVEALGRIGGREAHEALAAAFPRSSYPPAVLQAIAQRAGDPEVAEIMRQLVDRSPHARAALIESLERPELDGWIDFLPPADIGGEELLDLVLADAEEAVAAPLRSVVRAVARFQSPRATRYLEDVARREVVDPEVSTARAFLGARGHLEYVRQAVEDELTEICERRSHPWDIDRLRKNPLDIVRDAILARLERRPGDATALRLLCWFATDRDRAIFERHLGGDDARLADIAHRYLGRPQDFE